MAPKVSEHGNGTLINIGDDVRVERRFTPELNQDGSVKVDKDGNPIHKWVIYEREHTGVKYKSEHGAALKAGKHLDENHNVKHDLVETMGVHPVIKGKDGKGIETTSEYIWVPRGTADSKDEAVASANKLGR
jgi:hypothetical protein